MIYHKHNRAIDDSMANALRAKIEEAFHIKVSKNDLTGVQQLILDIEERCVGRFAGHIEDYVLLYYAVYSHCLKPENTSRAIIEIGTLFGCSCILINRAVRDANARAKIYSIDPLGGYYSTDLSENKGEPKSDIVSGLEVNEENVRLNFDKFGIKESDCEIVREVSQSSKAIQAISDLECSFLFVDGDHTRVGLFRDLSNYLMLAEDGARIVIDNFVDPDWLEVSEELFRGRYFESVLNPLVFENRLLVCEHSKRNRQRRSVYNDIFNGLVTIIKEKERSRVAIRRSLDLEKETNEKYTKSIVAGIETIQRRVATIEAIAQREPTDKSDQREVVEQLTQLAQSLTRAEEKIEDAVVANAVVRNNEQLENQLAQLARSLARAEGKIDDAVVANAVVHNNEQLENQLAQLARSLARAEEKIGDAVVANAVVHNNEQLENQLAELARSLTRAEEKIGDAVVANAVAHNNDEVSKHLVNLGDSLTRAEAKIEKAVVANAVASNNDQIKAKLNLFLELFEHSEERVERAVETNSLNLRNFEDSLSVRLTELLDQQKESQLSLADLLNHQGRQLRASSAEVSLLVTKLGDLAAKRDEANIFAENLSKRVEELGRELVERERRIVEAKQQNEREAEQHKAERDSLKQRIDASEYRGNELDRVLEKIRKEYEQVKRTNEQFKQDLATAHARIEDMTKKTISLEQVLESLLSRTILTKRSKEQIRKELWQKS